MGTTPTPATYEQALEAQQQVEQRIEEWQGKRAAKFQEIAAFERDGPQQVLEGKMTPEAYSRQLAELRDQIPMAENILATLRTQLQAAKRAAKVARIADMRVLADEREREGKALLKRREAILKQLEEFEGSLYMKNPRSQQLIFEAERLRENAHHLELRLDPDPHYARYNDGVEG